MQYRGSGVHYGAHLCLEPKPHGVQSAYWAIMTIHIMTPPCWKSVSVHARTAIQVAESGQGP